MYELPSDFIKLVCQNAAAFVGMEKLASNAVVGRVSNLWPRVRGHFTPIGVHADRLERKWLLFIWRRRVACPESPLGPIIAHHIHLRRAREFMPVLVIILMGRDMSVSTREGEGPAIDQHILEDV